MSASSRNRWRTRRIACGSRLCIGWSASLTDRRRWSPSTRLRKKTIIGPFDALRLDLGADNDALRLDLGADNDALRLDLGADNDALRLDLGADNDALRLDLGADKLLYLLQQSEDIGLITSIEREGRSSRSGVTNFSGKPPVH